MNNNTKLGLQNSVLVAAIYVSGIVSPIIMFGLILYTLFVEEDVFSKLSAKRAVMLYVLFSGLTIALYVFDYSMRIFSSVVSDYNTVYTKISYFISLAENLCFLIMAVRAFFTQEVNPGALDTKMDDILGTVATSANTKSNAQEMSDYVFCDKCGERMLRGRHFCGKCGNKME